MSDNCSVTLEIELNDINVLPVWNDGSGQGYPRNIKRLAANENNWRAAA